MMECFCGASFSTSVLLLCACQPRGKGREKRHRQRGLRAAERGLPASALRGVMASTEFSNSPQVTQFTAAELGANSWRPGNAGRGRKKCSGRRQVSCLARVGQAASVQAWEKRGVGLERRQPPGRPSWEPLRFCRPPARPPASPFPGSQPEPRLQLTPKSGRIRNVEVGPKGLVAHSPPNHAHPASECITWRRGWGGPP